MTNDDPITVWIDKLRRGDALAAENLWNHFFIRIYDLAKHKLKLSTRRVYDEEDAAQSAFNSVCAGIMAGRFPDLQDRDNLWRLLLTITARKVAHQHRHDQQQRRDVRRNRSDFVFADSADTAIPAVDHIPSLEPTPEFAAEFVETCEILFQSLDDPQLRNVVTLRMEGYTDTEIADRLKCSRRTVQRRLEVIRRHWDRLELSGE